MQRCNSGEIFGATSAMLGTNLPPPPLDWNRVQNVGCKISAFVVRGTVKINAIDSFYILPEISANFFENEHN